MTGQHGCKLTTLVQKLSASGVVAVRWLDEFRLDDRLGMFWCDVAVLFLRRDCSSVEQVCRVPIPCRCRFPAAVLRCSALCGGRWGLCWADVGLTDLGGPLERHCCRGCGVQEPSTAAVQSLAGVRSLGRLVRFDWCGVVHDQSLGVCRFCVHLKCYSVGII